jgi:hypothetical protein
MDMERSNLKKLNEEVVKEKYRVTIKKDCSSEYLDDNGTGHEQSTAHY